MSLAYFVTGIFVGVVLGLGGALFYLRWKMRRQIGLMEDQMDDLMNATQDLTEDVDIEEVENKEEKDE